MIKVNQMDIANSTSKRVNVKHSPICSKSSNNKTDRTSLNETFINNKGSESNKLGHKSLNNVIEDDGNKSISCIQSLLDLSRTRNIKITIDGANVVNIFKVLSLNNYKAQLLKLCGLIMIGFFVYLIKRFPYYPVTIIGNTVYSRVVAATLRTCNIAYTLCKSNNRVTYYETADNKEIPFEGPSYQIFHHFIDKEETKVPIVPNLKAEIIKLEQHTGIKNLAKIQDDILYNFEIRNGVYLANIKDIISDETPNHAPVIFIKKFWGNMYYVMTTNEIWLTNIVITDTISPLQPTEIISTLYARVQEDKHNQYMCIQDKDKCSITESGNITTMYRENSYIVGIDLNINPISSEYSNHMIRQNDHDSSQVGIADSENFVSPSWSPIACNHSRIFDSNKYDECYKECIIYSLQNPRPFIHNNITLIHPFHLPPTWDPFLSIMIITRALLCS